MAAGEKEMRSGREAMASPGLALERNEGSDMLRIVLR